MRHLAEAIRTDWLLGNLLAAVSAGLGFAVRYALSDSLPPGYPFVTFFPPILLTTFLAGTRPGVLCAALSGLMAWYAFIPPVSSFRLDSNSAVALMFFTFVSSVQIALIHHLRAGSSRLAAEQQVTSRLYDEQRIIFQELQHRVANNMTFVSGLLHLQKRAVAANPQLAAVALGEATQRIDTMARIHRRLYDPALVSLPVGQYFQEICTDLLQATGARNVVVLVDMPTIQLDITRLMTLSLLVTEVVTNSLKHAFIDRDGGTIRLKLERLDPGRLQLIVEDDGRGPPPMPAKQALGSGLGSRIIEGLAQQLQGELSLHGEPGKGMRAQLLFTG